MAKFEMHDLSYKAKYKGLNMICFHCGRFGHRCDVCPLLVKSKDGEAIVAERVAEEPMPVEENKPFGDWMIVKQRQRLLSDRRRSRVAFLGAVGSLPTFSGHA